MSTLTYQPIPLIACHGHHWGSYLRYVPISCELILLQQISFRYILVPAFGLGRSARQPCVPHLIVSSLQIATWNIKLTNTLFSTAVPVSFCIYCRASPSARPLLSSPEGRDFKSTIDFTPSKLAYALFENPPLLNTSEIPLERLSAFDLGSLAALQSTNKWSFVETRFSSFLYILFEPP